jgi:drug/metabolite transporter (DMT)-like permease
VGATKASATTFLIPPVALLLGVLVRGESVAGLSVMGGVVCLGGAWLMRRAQLEHAVRGPAPRLAAQGATVGSEQEHAA